MADNALDDTSPMLTAADIQWAPVAPELPRYDDLGIKDRLIEALIDAQAYRTLAQQALHALHDLTVEQDRLRQQHHRVLDEYRQLRESILAEAG